MKTRRVLIFGCGYVGFPLAKRLVAAGHAVVTVTRNRHRLKELSAAGLQPHLGDWLDRRSLQGLPPADRVLVAVGYDRSAGRSQREVYVQGLRNALEAVQAPADWVYLSSTGVYHQNDGEWVDESSPCRPSREGGQAHLEAESLLWRHLPDAKVVILRLAGIYGPHRLPRLHDLRAGTPIPAAANGWLNLIHRHDVGSAVLAAWDHPQPRRCYVVADGHPVRRAEYYIELARLAGAPSPTFTEPTAGSTAAARSASDKRIWTARLQKDLLPMLKYPSFMAGLRGALAQQD